MQPDGEVAKGWLGRAFPFWLRLAVSIALLVALTRVLDVDAIAAALRRARAPWLLGALALYVASHLLNSWRWALHAAELGMVAPFARFRDAYFKGLFLNLFVPGTVAGDLARGLDIGGEEKRAAALASVVIHRASGLVALVAIAAVAFFWQREIRAPALVSAAALVVPAVGLLALVVAPWLIGPLRRFARSSWPVAMMSTLALALAYHALQIACVVCVARSLSLAAPAGMLALFVPLVNIAGMVPVSVGGIGVRESAYHYLLGVIGIEANQALALGLSTSAIVVATALLALPVFLRGSRRAPD